MKQNIHPGLAAVIVIILVVVVAAALVISGRRRQAVIPQGLHINKRSFPAMPPPPRSMLYTHGPVTGSAKKFSPGETGAFNSRLQVPKNPYASGGPQIPAPQ